MGDRYLFIEGAGSLVCDEKAVATTSTSAVADVFVAVDAEVICCCCVAATQLHMLEILMVTIMTGNRM
jgi:hypothetical protein